MCACFSLYAAVCAACVRADESATAGHCAGHRPSNNAQPIQPPHAPVPERRVRPATPAPSSLSALFGTTVACCHSSCHVACVCDWLQRCVRGSVHGYSGLGTVSGASSRAHCTCSQQPPGWTQHGITARGEGVPCDRPCHQSALVSWPRGGESRVRRAGPGTMLCVAAPFQAATHCAHDLGCLASLWCRCRRCWRQWRQVR